MMRRREALKAMAALPLAAACAPRPPTSKKGSSMMPTIFLAHGAPPLLDDDVWMDELHAWAKAMPRPRSVLMISAHWDERPLALGATTTVPLVYDFYGFPQRFYELQYPSPGAPELAARVRGLLDGAKIDHADDPDRGLDHGAFVPLMAMYPEADVPVLQISLPGLEPKDVAAVGKALAPLRREDVLVVGSGFITHNMRLGFREGTPDWAREFDEWTAGVVQKHDQDALQQFLAKGPNARTALPTTEHFVPLIAAAACAPDDDVQFPITGWWMNSGFTRRSVQFG
jgi:4,5-DOPA dioxygenase extradiol